jgi:hypothetical protein
MAKGFHRAFIFQFKRGEPMRLLIPLFICAVSLFGADSIVFRGTPTIRVLSTADNDQRTKLEADAGAKNECVIVQRGKKYYWQSRGNELMTRIDSSQFTYFVHTGGAGYVKIFTGVRDAAAAADYIEHINQQGFEVVTYWGKAETTAK